MKKFYSVCYLSVLLFFGVHTSLNATPITISDFSGSETVINFSEPVTYSPTHLSIGGVEISSNPMHTIFVNPGYDWVHNGHPVSGDMILWGIIDGISGELGVTANRVGMYIVSTAASTFRLTVYTPDDSLIESTSVSIPSGVHEDYGGSFIGIESYEKIGYFILESQIDDPNDDQFTILDDLRFESFAPAPEPATILLLGMGLLGVAGVSRRRK